MNSIIDDIEYLFSSKEKRKYLDCVPPRCRDCKLLNICRNKENEWKCFHGCIILNYRDTLPQKCKDCFLLVFCRDEYNHYEFKHNKCLLRRKGEEYKL